MKRPQYPEPGSVYPIEGKCAVVGCMEKAACEVKEEGFRESRRMRFCENCAEKFDADSRAPRIRREASR